MDKSVFTQTMEQLDRRVSVIFGLGLSPESEFLRQGTQIIHSISEWKGQLCYYDFQTAINPTMRSIYEPQTYQFGAQKKKLIPILQPPSQGQQSITQSSDFQPSFYWISSRLIDSTLVKYDSPQPQKVDHSSQLSEQWAKSKDLIFLNVAKGLFTQKSSEDCKEFVKSRLQKFLNNIQFYKCQQIYYHGKEAILVKFKNQTSAQFAHYNISKSIHLYRQQFGSQISIGRVYENKLKQTRTNWVAMILRKLPASINKDNLTPLLKKADIKVVWVSEIVQIGEWKYALVGIQTLQDVFKTVQHFKNNSSYKEFKQLKVNLHPQSKKIWTLAHTPQEN